MDNPMVRWISHKAEEFSTACGRFPDERNFQETRMISKSYKIVFNLLTRVNLLEYNLAGKMKESLRIETWTMN